jgi:hypothetical protein
LGSSVLCTGDTGYLVADLSGTPPWSVSWSDGQTNDQILGTPFIRPLILTNSSDVPTNYSFYIQGLSNSTTVLSLTTNDTGEGVFTVGPPLTNAPILLNPDGTVYSCSEVSPLLSVSVPSFTTAVWFDTQTNMVADSTNFSVPIPNSVSLPVTNTYFVTTHFGPPGAGCYSTNMLMVDVVFETCSKQLETPFIASSTNFVLSWQGNFYLEEATNLVPPIYWQTLTQGAFSGENFWTNPIVTLQEYFRLSNTNSSPVGGP